MQQIWLVMAAAGMTNSQTLAEIMTQNTLLPIPTAVLAVEEIFGIHQQMKQVMAATGTWTTLCGVILLMMMISLLHQCVQPAWLPMLSLQESRLPIQRSTYREEHSHFPLLDSRKSH